MEPVSGRASNPMLLILFILILTAVPLPETVASSSSGNTIVVTGESPFSSCTADFPGSQSGTVFIGSEVEPWIAVNPTDPDNIVGTWQQDRWSDGGARGLSVAVTFDGGEGWQLIPLPDLTRCTGGEFLRASDPWLSFAPNGDLLHMSLGLDLRFGRSAMLVQRSIDGGLTWSAPLSLIDEFEPFFNDKNSITADPIDSNFIYATWDRLDLLNDLGPAVLSRSTDGGESFEPATVIHDPGPLNQTIGNQIVVLPDGRVIDFFTLISRDFRIPLFSLAMKYSNDKGETWLPDGRGTVHVSSMLSTRSVVEPKDHLPIRDASIVFDVAVDPTVGTLYAVWQDGRFSDFRHDSIALSVSIDGGFTWSEPVQVNATPRDIPAINQQAFIPSVHVNEKGRVAITYYDFRLLESGQEALADYWGITCSKNQDCSDPENWRGEIRLTDEPFDFQDAPFARGLFLGDYAGLTSTGDEFVAFFGVAHTDDPASIYMRKFRFRNNKKTLSERGPLKRLNPSTLGPAQPAQPGPFRKY